MEKKYICTIISNDGSYDSCKLVETFNKQTTKIHPDILTMEGMSGKKFRIFMNNLIESIENVNYLEIGSWYGSTACSTIYGNKLSLTCIDNWSEHYGRNMFIENYNKFTNDNVTITLIENDFRSVDYNNIGKFNVYMFDGPHNENDQYDGVKIVQNALTDTYILIVDDYNHERVRNGTQNALRDLNSKILCEIIVRTSDDDSQPSVNCQNSDWHNGCYIALIGK